MGSDDIRVGLIGSGWAAGHRAAAVVEHPRTHLVVVADSDEAAGRQLAEGCRASFVVDWNQMLGEFDVDVVVVATPNGQLAEVTIGALKAGRHVLVEGPMGRNVSEAVAMAGAATSAERLLKVGFNHRYHPALTRAHAYFSEGVIGPVISLRARYGQGARPGLSAPWRENRELAGGGQLTDHGMHVIDLLHWFGGEPKEVFTLLQTAVWPVKPLEDNAFALLRFESGAVATMHTSWTQWTDLFSFEIFGPQGSIAVEGLGGSYGPEKLTVARRRADGSRPYTEETVFDDEDISWSAEWAELVMALDEGRPYMGSAHDGVTAMNILDGLYRSAESGALVTL